MNKTLRIILAVLTLLLLLGSLALAIFAITIASIGMCVTAMAFGVLFGLFCYHDYQFFFGKKPADVQPKI